jgi:hypothetical protein
MPEKKLRGLLFQMLEDALAKIPPTQEQLDAMIIEARQLKCGFTMEKGKPGTFRVSPFSPENQIIVFDPTLLNGLGVEKIAPSGLEIFTDDDKLRMDQVYVQESLCTRALGPWNRGGANPPLTANSLNS